MLCPKRPRPLREKHSSAIDLDPCHCTVGSIYAFDPSTRTEKTSRTKKGSRERQSNDHASYSGKKKGFVKISEKSSASSSARNAPSCVRHYAIVFPFACTRTPVYYLTFLGDRALSEGYVMQPYAQPNHEEFAVHSKSAFSRRRQCARIHPFLWPNTRLKSLLPYCQFNTPVRI